MIWRFEHLSAAAATAFAFAFCGWLVAGGLGAALSIVFVFTIFFLRPLVSRRDGAGGMSLPNPAERANPLRRL